MLELHSSSQSKSIPADYLSPTIPIFKYQNWNPALQSD